MDASKAFENVLLEQVAFGVQKRSKTTNRNILIGALDFTNSTVNVFGGFKITEIFTKNLQNAQIYRGLYPQEMIKKIADQSVTDTSSLLKAEIGISNITSHLTFELENNYPCVKGIDIVCYGLKNNVRYLKGKIAKKFVEQFKNEKLIAQEIIAHIQNPIPHIQIAILYDNNGRMFNDTCVEIKLLNSKLQKKFLLAYLQSAFCNWYSYNFIYNRAIRTMHFINYYVTQIPIPKRVLEDLELQNPFISIVDQILAAKQKDPDADTSALEGQIDRMVYKLYDLTSEEIAIVEGYDV